MREITIDAQGAGRRLDKWMASELPLLPAGLRQKYLRIKRVRLNGRPAKPDARLAEGDVLNLYIGDEFFEKPKQVDPLLAGFHPHLTILYEDENLLLVDKRPGLMVHPDENEKVNTLVTHVRAYLYQKGEYDSRAQGAFAPAPCNRIDRFTGGIVIFAKNAQALHDMNMKIRAREVKKYYYCAISGRMTPSEGELKGFILKQEKRVQLVHAPRPGAQAALLRYRTLYSEGGLSLLECELITGRTHQIRAQFADAGHPLVGDGQYGDARINARFHRSQQALYACRIEFCFEGDSGVLDGLNGRSFHVRRVPFVEELFPGWEP